MTSSMAKSLLHWRHWLKSDWLKTLQLILAGIVVAAHLLTIDHFVCSIEMERNYQPKLKLTEAYAGTTSFRQGKVPGNEVDAGKYQ